MEYEVYKISNDINDKLYIGITSCGAINRFNQHKKAKSYIGKAIRKHGANHFKIEVIDTAETKQEIMDKEVYWVDYYDSFNNGYNLTVGGEGISLNYRIQIQLDKRQKQFISYVEKENEKPIDIDGHEAMVKMILINLIRCYLISDNKRDKKESAKLIAKLKSDLLKSVLKTKVIEIKELKSWLI
ncbi:GIY-YIG nuclease family protein [Staphylococcus sp. 47.1]|uniref:GIY-YIG nuclease family protein n=1 Tax=Staphylococcus sp. 47.1 TaxID=1929484 RepID=UPI000947037E|nr:GIY-YIG nuclease family protein [Staphylococcus sp. 47.1]OLF32228.1 hypothetical protein BSZ11_06765 [Staphylococcus sp. 47.1]